MKLKQLTEDFKVEEISNFNISKEKKDYKLFLLEKKKAQTLPLIGVPNYFDSQRFGSVIKNQFIAKFLLIKYYEQAVKVYLTP